MEIQDKGKKYIKAIEHSVCNADNVMNSLMATQKHSLQNLLLFKFKNKWIKESKTNEAGPSLLTLNVIILIFSLSFMTMFFKTATTDLPVLLNCIYPPSNTCYIIFYYVYLQPVSLHPAPIRSHEEAQLESFQETPEEGGFSFCISFFSCIHPFSFSEQAF